MDKGKMEKFEDTIYLYQPLGFLEQLGKELKRPVGLGKLSIKEKGCTVKWLELPVRTADRELGVYTIVIDGKKVYGLNYDGAHPLCREESKISLGLNRSSPLDFSRYDKWNEIVFPGLG